MVAKAWGLLAEYLLEGNADDSSGSGLNGVVSGAVLAAGRFGQGYSFDGADDQVTVAHNVIQEPANITVAAWIYPLAGYGEVAPKIVSKLALVPLKGYDFFITPATGILSWSLVLGADVAATTIVSAAAITTDAWSHVIGTYDGATMNLFVNGALSATQGGLSGNIAHATAVNMGIGCIAAATTRTFKGVIDSVTIWNRALPIGEGKQARSGFIHGGM